MSLKPFVIFMSLMQSMLLLFLLDRIIDARYFHGSWGRVYMFADGFLLMLCVFAQGTWAVRRAKASEAPPDPRSDKIGLLSGASSHHAGRLNGWGRENYRAGL